MRSLEEMQQLFAEKGYRLLSDEYKGNKSYLTFEKDGYLYYNSYNGFIKTDNPKKWSVSNPYSLQNLQKWVKENGGECVIISETYHTKDIKACCPCGKEYITSMSNFVTHKQFVCAKCGHLRGNLKHRKDEESMQVLADHGLTLLEEYKGVKDSHYMKTEDGYVVRTSVYNLKIGLNERDYIFDAGNEYALENMNLWLKLNTDGVTLVSDEYLGAKERYRFKCFCGNVFETNWQYFRLQSPRRCPICTRRVSTNELKAMQWLEENKIDYIPEKSFEDCCHIVPLRFDFYLSKLHKIIEIDGEQHFYPVSFGGISKQQAQLNFERSQERDKIKNDYCVKNNIPLLRIPYYEFDSDNYKQILKTFTAKS